MFRIENNYKFYDFSKVCKKVLSFFRTCRTSRCIFARKNYKPISVSRPRCVGEARFKELPE